MGRAGGWENGRRIGESTTQGARGLPSHLKKFGDAVFTDRGNDCRASAYNLIELYRVLRHFAIDRAAIPHPPCGLRAGHLP